MKMTDGLTKIMSGSHCMYAACDVIGSKRFFPDKRVPLVISDIADNAALSMVCAALTEAYGEGKEVVCCYENGEICTTVLSLRQQSDGIAPNFPCKLVLGGEILCESKRFDATDLIEIIRVLRSPNGCPWDKAQTHRTLRTALLEETYELLEGIEAGDVAMMREESGDVTLQGLFNTQIAEDSGEFTYVDMLTALCRKLVDRHTHIFGSDKATSSEQALDFWQAAKLKEKKLSTCAEQMEHIAKTFPATVYAVKAQKVAAKVGFDFSDAVQASEKINEELAEYFAATTDEAREEEAGDLLFAVCNVIRFAKVNPELALMGANRKFVERFTYVESAIAKEGKRLEDCTVEEMEEKWIEAKRVKRGEN